MGSGKTVQHGAVEPLHPRPLEVSGMLAAPYERHSTRSWTGQTQTACDPSKARLPDFGVSFSPQSVFLLLLFSPSIYGDFYCMGVAQKKT